MPNQFRLTIGGPIKNEFDPVVTSLRKETFQEQNFDACGLSSNSDFSASFLFEVLSLPTNRVSDKAAEVDGTGSHGVLRVSTTEMVLRLFLSA